ncbi:hypothetical protein RB628_12040 [Streptomyces sp. ADMS]|uniref:hypothetical protein n=1 Tax=Streptomyces sp. ADMS TaxID=3071415 RepID=UPI00296EAA29|nr:hypothetical protein [Streptomyces sp. ADMS]MDW4906046.1 hypothetical protein [Streptomyces sp. ADMS]
MTPRQVRSPHEERRPPVPMHDRGPCRDLAVRRDTARAAFDHSAVSDANVLLRAHLLDAHSST